MCKNKYSAPIISSSYMCFTNNVYKGRRGDIPMPFTRYNTIHNIIST
jgi:hypothetical protein